MAFAFDVLSGLDLPSEQRISAAFHAILRHELFHFETDCMTANWELSLGRAVYWPGREEAWHQSLRETEEGLANAYLLRGFRYPEGPLRGTPGCYKALSDFCKLQPPGYRDGPYYAKSRAAYLNGCRDLSAKFYPWDMDIAIDRDAFNTAIFYPSPFRIDWRRCPIFVHDEFGLLKRLGIDVSFIEKIKLIKETTSFRKSLSKLGPDIEKAWDRTREKLARDTNLKAVDFKRCAPRGEDWYSARVGGNYRAHLRRNKAENIFIAEEIGDHKSMGHG